MGTVIQDEDTNDVKADATAQPNSKTVTIIAILLVDHICFKRPEVENSSGGRYIIKSLTLG